MKKHLWKINQEYTSSHRSSGVHSIERLYVTATSSVLDAFEAAESKNRESQEISPSTIYLDIKSIEYLGAICNA